MTVLSFPMWRRFFDKSIAGKSEIMMALEAVVDELTGHGFKGEPYAPNSRHSLMLNPSLSNLATLNHQKLNLGSLETGKPGTHMPTYHLLGMVLPDSGDGRQWWLGGGWVLESSAVSDQRQLIVINVGGRDPDRPKPEDVEIEALRRTVVPGMGYGLESLGRFTLDTLAEVTARSVMAEITRRFPPMFPQANAG